MDPIIKISYNIYETYGSKTPLLVIVLVKGTVNSLEATINSLKTKMRLRNLKLVHLKSANKNAKSMNIYKKMAIVMGSILLTVNVPLYSNLNMLLDNNDPKP